MIIKNLTGSFINLTGLITNDINPISSPSTGSYDETGISAGATINLLTFNTPGRIFESYDLGRHIATGDIVIFCDGVQLDTTQSFEHFQTFGLQCALDGNDIKLTVGAEIYSENEGGNINLTVLSQFEIYDQFEANGQSRLCTPDQANNKITIDRAGVYFAACSIDTEGTAGQKFQWEIHKNGFRNPNCSGRASFLGGAITRNISINGFIVCAAADVLDLRVRCYTTATATAKGRDVNLTVFRVF